MPRREILVILVAGVLLALLMATSRPDDPAGHNRVLTAFKQLQAADAERNHQLIALRYGLSRNYDGLREIERRERELRAIVAGAPAQLDGADARDLERALGDLADLAAAKAVVVEDFVSENAMLVNALRSLPTATAHILNDVGSDLGAAVVHELDALQGSVYQYSFTGDEHVRRRCEDALERLETAAAELGPEPAAGIETVSFLGRVIIHQQMAVDSTLRRILSDGLAPALHVALTAYLDSHGSQLLRGERLRWVLYASCAVLLVYTAYTLLRLDHVNASIEQRVIERTAELAASREELRSLVETTQAVPWRWDRSQARFTYVGPQASAILGRASEEWLLPEFWTTRVHPEDRGALDRDDQPELEIRLARDGGGWSVVRIIRGGAGSGQLHGFLLDVTERRRMEGDLRQALKLEAVGRLASGVAHEINTPVQFVSDNVHFLSDAFANLVRQLDLLRALGEAVTAGRTPEELQTIALAAGREEEAIDLAFLLEETPRALEQALEGLAQVATIVRSMKELAHPDQRDQAAVDLNRCIESALTVARHEYKLVAELEKDFGELPPVPCYAGDLNQAILNIVVNAAHAIADVVRGSEDKGTIRVRTGIEGEHAVVEISDTGTGIPDAIRDRIFDPFFTTKAVGKGTGQGLAIARSIVVEKHHGRLEVESRPGQGSKFSIYLPLHARVEREKVRAA